MKRQVSPCPKADPLFGAEHDSQQHHRLWRPQGIDDWLLWLTIDGEVEVCLDDDQITMTRGDWCLIPPHVPHDYGPPETAEPHWHVVWVVFQLKPAWQHLTQWARSFKAIGVQELTDKAVEAEALRALRESLNLREAGWPGSIALACNRLESCLLWLYAGADEQAWDPRVRTVVDQVLEHLDQPFDLNQLAANAALSVPQFSRLFKRDVGTSPARWLQAQRLERAKLHLESSKESITDIAYLCGFNDVNYFCRCFKTQYHCSPGQYRSQQS